MCVGGVVVAKLKSYPSSESAPRLKRWARAAREAGIPYNTLRDAALRGQLPVVKIGKAWYAEPADIDKFIAARKTLLS